MRDQCHILDDTAGACADTAENNLVPVNYLGEHDMQSTLRDILAQHGRLAAISHTLPEAADLFAAGLDSLAIVNVMLAIENEFNIEFPDEYLNRGTFSSILTLSNTIQMLQSRLGAA